MFLIAIIHVYIDLEIFVPEPYKLCNENRCGLMSEEEAKIINTQASRLEHYRIVTLLFKCQTNQVSSKRGERTPIVSCQI